MSVANLFTLQTALASVETRIAAAASKVDDPDSLTVGDFSKTRPPFERLLKEHAMLVRAIEQAGGGEWDVRSIGRPTARIGAHLTLTGLLEQLVTRTQDGRGSRIE